MIDRIFYSVCLMLVQLLVDFSYNFRFIYNEDEVINQQLQIFGGGLLSWLIVSLLIAWIWRKPIYNYFQ